MKLVGLTGGIGSGKSSVAEALRALGATVVDADAIVHELQRKGSPLLDEMVAAFGPGILRADGELDRKALADVVFRDPDARKHLGDLVHPKVGAEMMARVAAARAAGARVVVMDVPLLLEGRRAAGGGSAAARAPYDCVVVVWVPESVQIERTVARDGCTREEAERRVRAQMSLDEKRRLADHVIDNAGSREETATQVRALWDRLLED
ncbi:MAG TPA: dephospho-CoA kinase [Myxococcota bacterium]|nr:dephospho-CoA kinase [Myxococcota bacterium]